MSMIKAQKSIIFQWKRKIVSVCKRLCEICESITSDLIYKLTFNKKVFIIDLIYKLR